MAFCRKADYCQIATDGQLRCFLVMQRKVRFGLAADGEFCFGNPVCSAFLRASRAFRFPVQLLATDGEQ